jgi:outer membrane immunogenic protein
MRRLSVALIAAVSAIAFTQIASAADLPRKTPAYTPPPPPVYSWTGFYVGANGGYGWSNRDVDYTPNDTGAESLFFPGAPPSVSFESSGALGGLQLGYNWQFNPNWLLGLETDFDFSGIKGAGTAAGLAEPLVGPFPFTATAAEKVTWFGTVRARLGYIPVHNLLIYGTGGFAYGRVEQTVSFINNSNAELIFGAPLGFTCVPGRCFVGNSTRTATGWTAGGGLEYAFGNNWSVRAEYLFVNLGGNSVTETATAPGNPGQGLSTFTASFGDTAFHVVRGGLNYRF